MPQATDPKRHNALALFTFPPPSGSQTVCPSRFSRLHCSELLTLASWPKLMMRGTCHVRAGESDSVTANALDSTAIAASATAVT